MSGSGAGGEREMSELRYGIIGTGMMGVEHVHNLLHVDGARITALADPHEASREAAAALVPDAAVHADHRALLDAGDCDAVVIASPNMTHIDLLRDVLPTDLHVMVEKPLCTTVVDCYEVLDLASERDALTWVGLEYRYIPRSPGSSRRSTTVSSGGRAWCRSASTGSPSSARSATGTGSVATPAERSSRSAATSST
ncbi:MAG: Gfo/Idh/MocA family oxidoreductase [Acidimicrobiales bacterium]